MRSLTSAALVAFSCGAAYGQAVDARPEFEVASVKPSPPPGDGRGMRVGWNGGPGTNDPGRFTTENLSLNNLMTLAYEIPDYRLTAPDWMQSARFDIVAKIPEGATKEQFQLMLQRLLVERFRLALHHEQKEMQAYELSVGKNGSKFKESADEQPAPAADPAVSSLPPRQGLDQDGFPAIPPGNSPYMRMMKGRARWRLARTSMEEFSQSLAVQLGRPVSDSTGLKGKYDFTLSWVIGPVSATSTDDTPGPTLPGAVQEQLGLKLESKKMTVDILVVDHMEKVPTEN
jgi:uncharacterized protein (TIGR03435 family)